MSNHSLRAHYIRLGILKPSTRGPDDPTPMRAVIYPYLGLDYLGKIRAAEHAAEYFADPGWYLANPFGWPSKAEWEAQRLARQERYSK